MLLIPALGRQVDLCEIEGSLVYIANFRSAGATGILSLKTTTMEGKGVYI